MQMERNMRSMLSLYLPQTRLFTRKDQISEHFASTGKRQRHLPKLNVAGSIPVSRSKPHIRLSGI
jgi:hypothetical protein